MNDLDQIRRLNRFGLGVRPADADKARAVTARLFDELKTAQSKTVQSSRAQDEPRASSDILIAERRFRQQRRAERETQRDADTATEPSPNDLLLEELGWKIDRVRAAEIGLVERLTAFWSNHFAVQASSDPRVRALAGAFEREAIRPHVLGRFAKLLRAAIRHPAMLLSLDNERSIGPNSPAGRRRSQGLNENLAREILELHTLGVDGGYTQADVTAFANVLTGWTFGLTPQNERAFGRFAFREVAHEPGPKSILGRDYPERGRRQGDAVLRDLAGHPATAKRVATKLVRHFVSAPPDEALVDDLSEIFERTNGNLRALMRRLLQSETVKTTPATLMRTPQEFLWASLRALDIDIPARTARRMLRALGQPPWDPPSPAGFPDAGAAWMSPGGLNVRLDVASRLASLAGERIDPRMLAEQVLGPNQSRQTRETIAQAASSRQGLAILLMSPEFQRR